MIITIGGHLGAGKTTLAETLATTLGFQELYVGAIFRDMAAARNVSIEAFYDELKNNAELEKEVDARQTAFMQHNDNVIVQGRVAWYFAKQSPFQVCNILLTVAPEEGARRAQSRPEYVGKTVIEVMAANTFRMATELERYKKLYGIANFLDPAHYNIVIDTTNLHIEQVAREAMEQLALQRID